MLAGIYRIDNSLTGQFYIGRSVKARARIAQHLNYLRRDVHQNPYMQASFNKYGQTAFSGRIICICRREDLAFYEHMIIAGLGSDQRPIGFNLTIATDDGRFTHTPEARAAIAEYNRTRKPKYVRTPEIRAKIAASLTGKVGPNKGKKFSPEHCAKLAAAKIGNRHRVGKVRSPEDRAQISASVIAYRAANPAAVAQQAAKAATAYADWRNNRMEG